jgi:serine protease inhibitor
MINRFVEETTRGRIRDLVSADMLQPRGADEFVG